MEQRAFTIRDVIRHTTLCRDSVYKAIRENRLVARKAGKRTLITLQTLYWYDRPELSQHEPELEFWDQIPTTWDETRVLQGTPGQFVSTARRKGEQWFVGTITGNEARALTVRLDFLPKGKRYLATVYADDPKAPTRTKVSLTQLKVTSASKIDAPLLASGGQAIWLRPAD